MALDLSGNITLMLSVITVFLLIVGLPMVRGVKNFENLKRHGYLTIIALILETIIVFVVMIPSFQNNIDVIFTLPIAESLDTWLHVGLGIFALVSGFAYIALWLVYSRSRMMCYKAKKWMMPTFVIWIIVTISGAIIHLVQFF